jgi:hypothetical protein
MYVKVENNIPVVYPYSIVNLKTDYPNTSFPAVLSNERLAQFGVYPVEPTEPPQASYTYNVEEDTPVYNDGTWYQEWSVNEASVDEKAERLEGAWNSLRDKRNSLLSSCDWTMLEDAPINKTAWAAYRMALRFLPEATQDPFNPVWPQKPL